MNGRNPTAPTPASAHVEARGGLLARLGVPSATPRPSRWRTGDRTRDRARECINALHLISVYCIEDQDAGSTLALLRGVPSVVRGGAVAAVSVVGPPFAVADRAPG